MSVTESLRNLDRKVLREDRPLTADRWRRTAARWRLMLATSYVLVVAYALLLARQGLRGIGLVPALAVPVYLAFQAGQCKAEHDRLQGRRGAFLRRRPPELDTPPGA